MKKTLGFSLIGITLALLGVAAHTTAQSSPVTLKFWTSRVGSTGAYDKEIALFEAANPNIKIERTTTAGAQYTQVIDLAFKGGDTPDVFTIPTDSAPDIQVMIDSKWFLPLNKWATRSWQANFPKNSFLEGVNIFGGQIISAPFNGGGGNYLPLFINNKVFRDAGLVDASGAVLIPKTWAEERLYAKQILERSNGTVYGVGFGAKSGDYPLNIQAQSVRMSGQPTHGPLGYYYHNPKIGRFEFASNPVWRDWFDFWIGMKEDGSIYPQSLTLNDEQLRPIFAQGKFGMYVNGPWMVNSLKETSPNFTDYSVATLPMRTAKATSYIYTGLPASREMAISSKTKNPEAAWKFFEFMNSKVSATRWVSYGEQVRVWPETATAATGKAGEVARVGLLNNRIAPTFEVVRPVLNDVKIKLPTQNLEYLILAVASGQLKRADLPAALKKLETDYNAALEEAVTEAQKAGSKVTLDDFKFANWNPLVNQPSYK
jgi:ABC-type glycerol-3-phosphate transport system substrate-binding protein